MKINPVQVAIARFEVDRILCVAPSYSIRGPLGNVLQALDLEESDSAALYSIDPNGNYSVHGARRPSADKKPEDAPERPPQRTSRILEAVSDHVTEAKGDRIYLWKTHTHLDGSQSESNIWPRRKDGSGDRCKVVSGDCLSADAETELVWGERMTLKLFEWDCSEPGDILGQISLEFEDIGGSFLLVSEARGSIYQIDISKTVSTTSVDFPV